MFRATGLLTLFHVVLLALESGCSSGSRASSSGATGSSAGPASSGGSASSSRATSVSSSGSGRQATATASTGSATSTSATSSGGASSSSSRGGTSGSPSSGSSSSSGTVTTGATSSGYLPVATPDAGVSRYTLIFDDEFDTLSLAAPSACFNTAYPESCAPDAGGTWLPLYTWNNRTLSSNSEAEIYVDPTYTGSGAGCTTPLGLDPFSLDGGILTISANPTPSADLACLMNLPYTSGAIITYPSFTTTYGFFETRAKLPPGQGLWPAFWLLDENLQWPPEIDIFEFIGGQYTTLEMHEHDSNATYEYGATSTVPDVSLAFHVYGLDWEPDTITWYFDGVPQAQAPTAPDLNQPMYVLLNLAVGGAGSWPGPPSAATVFPANMQIDYVRVWQKP